MARNTDFKQGLLLLLSVKWTTELPRGGGCLKSPNITIMQDSSWILELTLSCVEFTLKKYCLYLRNTQNQSLNKSIIVTTYLEDTEDNIPRGVNTLTIKSSSLVWSDTCSLRFRPGHEGSIFQWNAFEYHCDRKYTFICVFHDSLESAAEFMTAKKHISTQTYFIAGSPPNESFGLQTLSRDFSSFMKDETFSDVQLKCGDCTLSAHKSVLAARSEVFAAMFRNKMSERETSVVDVQDLDPDVLKLLLRYVYPGERPDLCLRTARRLYEAADKYGVDALKKTCSEYMVVELTTENCLDLLVLADQHTDEDFKEVVLRFVGDHLHLLSRESWSTFNTGHSELAVTVLEKRFADVLSGQI